MRPTHLFAHDKYLAGSEFAIYGCAWADGPMFASPKDASSEFSLSLGGDTIFAPLTLSTSVPPTITDPVVGTVGDVIEVPNDFDLFGVNLVAGQTYTISLRGSGATPLADPFLVLRNNALVVLNTDDDGGDGINSLLTFTAAYTGVHVIDARAFPGSGLTGTYTIEIVANDGLDESDSFATPVALAPGDTYYGYIDSAATGPYGPPFGEVDTFSITVEAGKVYVIEVAGGADYASNPLALPPGEIDPVIVVFNSDLDLVTVNDDINYPSDVSSRVSFVAESSGTYYFDVFSYQPWTGGYSVTTQELDPSDFSPLDSINWFSADEIDIPPDGIVKVYFGAPGETFGEPGPSFGWNAFEKQQVLDALNEYTKVIGIQYAETTNVADAEFRLFTTTSTQFGAYFYPQDPAFGTQQGIGAFNVNSGGWSLPGQNSLQQGGFAFAVILHEFGHAHGLAHPHDTGGGSDVMLGVTGPFDSYGIFDLNQGVYTVMSYNDAWPLHPDAPQPFTAATVGFGWSGTLSAFDIAVLQDRYGATAYATGNDVYSLKDVNAAGTYYETIWDTGGTDEIRYVGNRDTRIDLTAATLDYSPTGGGVVSFVDDIFGGYTIANGVVIENATGGEGDDILIGNAVANVLKGNGGDDFLMGGAGGDNLQGGSGFDTASYMNAGAGVTASLGSGTGSAGDAAGDTYSSIEKLEGSMFADNLSSGNASDTLSGLAGNDILTGGNGNDSLDGGAGNDALDGGNNNDVLNGGDGHDHLLGGNNNDTLIGGNGDDALFGGNNDDVLNGGSGNDVLNGGNNVDTLNGGSGNDVMSGGNFNDRFVFSETGGADQIIDFNRGQIDKVDLAAIDAVAGGADDAFTWIGAAAFSGTAGQLRSFSSGGNNFLAGDVNGDGVADFTIQTNIAIIQTDIIAF